VDVGAVLCPGIGVAVGVGVGVGAAALGLERLYFICPKPDEATSDSAAVTMTIRLIIKRVA
jgi:hypothetical protein